MTKKFRNSLFGFNRDDVMEFVVESKEKENSYKEKCNKLSDEIDNLTKLNTELNEKLSEAQRIADDFKSREEALTKLSESIGRLYLVTQTNANAVIASAKDSVAQSEICIDKNLDVASTAESELDEIGQVLKEKTQLYLAEVEVLKNKIANTRDRIEQNRVSIDEHVTALENIDNGVK